MHGPVNDTGDVAGRALIPNRGEAHAGWFQGKVDAWFDPERRDVAVKDAGWSGRPQPRGGLQKKIEVR